MLIMVIMNSSTYSNEQCYYSLNTNAVLLLLFYLIISMTVKKSLAKQDI